MNEEPKTAAEAASTASTLFALARRNTDRVIALIQAQIGANWKRKCPVCGEREVPLDLSETVISSRPELVLVWSDCAECRVRDSLKLSGVPENLVHATLDNWKVQVPEDEAALRKAREFIAAPVGFFTVSSREFGNGKSHLAAALIRVVLVSYNRPSKVRYITQAEIVRSLRRKYDDGRAEDVIANLSRVPFLVIDDFGVSAGGKDESPALYDILSNRYADRRATVLTTNFTPDQFRGAIGDRMASRLRESTFAWVEVRGPGYRAANRKAYLRG